MRSFIKYFIIIFSLLLAGQVQSSETKFSLPEGIIYQIVIDVNGIALSNKVIEQYHYASKSYIGKSTFQLFQFGKYRNYSETDSVVLLLGKNGCKNIFVKAYLDGYSITIPEAIAFQYNIEIEAYINLTQPNTKSVYLQEVNYLVDVQNSQLKHYYSLAVLIKDPQNVDILLETLNTEKITLLDADENIYAIGRYTSFKDVVEARKLFIKNEVQHVYILAQFNDERINDDDKKELSNHIKPVISFLTPKL